MTIITPTDKPGTAIHGPADPALARLWQAAISKFRAANRDADPASRADARAVIEEYNRLLAKPRGTIEEIAALWRPCAPHEERIDGGG